MNMPHVVSWATTHPGAKRTVNQDSFVNRPDLGVWAVADGAGGHAFADTYDQHQRNVAKLRGVEQQQQQAGPQRTTRPAAAARSNGSR